MRFYYFQFDLGLYRLYVISDDFDIECQLEYSSILIRTNGALYLIHTITCFKYLLIYVDRMANIKRY